MSDSKKPVFSRRHVLGAGAAMPLAALAPQMTRAAADMKGTGQSPFHRIKLGAFEVTSLLAATRPVPDPHNIFGLNVTDAEFASVSSAANIPTDVAQFFFTPTVVNTGSSLVLFDTGTNADGIAAALNAAGYGTNDIDQVVITHMHGDHIGGLMKDGTPTFANASYATGAIEFDAWDMSGNDGFESNVRPLAENMTMLEDGGSPASGITAMLAAGHTPGHMGYMIESEGKQLFLGADFANHYVWSLAHPDWEVKFDRDKAAAAQTRRRILDMLAADKIPFIGYHMPFPAMGFVSKAGDGYRYEPASYQLML